MKGASASTPNTSTRKATPSGPSFTMPMEQGFDPEDIEFGQEDLSLPRQVDYDQAIKKRRKQLNEQIYAHDKKAYAVTKRFWPIFEGVNRKMWPPIYVMKAKLSKKFQQWHEDNPIDDERSGYNKVDPER